MLALFHQIMQSGRCSLEPIHTKRALVIGNQDYNKKPLVNTEKDARDVAQALQSCGFQVILGTNLKRNQMFDHLNDIKTKSSPDDLVLFYYSGHGVQHDGINYLVPIPPEVQVDGTVKVKQDCIDVEDINVRRDCINVEEFLDDFSRKIEYVTIFVLDCCRDKVRTKSMCNSYGPGFNSMRAPGGTLIQYACSPGSVSADESGTGENGLFTKHFLKHLKVPGKRLDEFLAAVTRDVYVESRRLQLPSSVNSLMIDGPIYLNDRRSRKIEFTSSITF